MLKRPGWLGILAVGVVIGLAVGGAVVWATIPDSTTGTITACYPTSGTSQGALRVINYQAGTRCRTGEALLQWPSRSFRWRGAWASTTAYTVNDVVRYNGSAYIAYKANTNITPTNTAYWNLMVSKGATGPPGPVDVHVVNVVNQGNGGVRGGRTIACGLAAAAPNADGCHGVFAAGVVVTLEAFAGSSSVFDHWSGDCTGTAPTCVLTINASYNVRAVFVAG